MFVMLQVARNAHGGVIVGKSHPKSEKICEIADRLQNHVFPHAGL
jgi:hypothetical protein